MLLTTLMLIPLIGSLVVFMLPAAKPTLCIVDYLRQKLFLIEIEWFQIYKMVLQVPLWALMQVRRQWVVTN